MMMNEHGRRLIAQDAPRSQQPVAPFPVLAGCRGVALIEWHRRKDVCAAGQIVRRREDERIIGSGNQRRSVRDQLGSAHNGIAGRADRSPAHRSCPTLKSLDETFRPVFVRFAIVVREADEPASGRVRSRVARGGRARGRLPTKARSRPSRDSLGDSVTVNRSVVYDDHLEPFLRGLRREGLEAPPQRARAIARGDDDRDERASVEAGPARRARTPRRRARRGPHPRR